MNYRKFLVENLQNYQLKLAKPPIVIVNTIIIFINVTMLLQQQHIQVLCQRNLSLWSRSLMANSLLFNWIWYAVCILAPLLTFLPRIHSIIIKFLPRKIISFGKFSSLSSILNWKGCGCTRPCYPTRSSSITLV